MMLFRWYDDATSLARLRSMSSGKRVSAVVVRRSSDSEKVQSVPVLM
jgi:hypothetical protein